MRIIPKIFLALLTPSLLFTLLFTADVRAQECPSYSIDQQGFATCLKTQCSKSPTKLKSLRCQLKLFKQTRKTLTSLSDLQSILIFIDYLEKRIKKLSSADEAPVDDDRECNRKNSKTIFIIENNTQLPLVVLRERIGSEDTFPERLGDAAAEAITRIAVSTLPGRNSLYFDPFLGSMLNDPNIKIFKTEVVEKLKNEEPCRKRVTIELFDENFGANIVVGPTPEPTVAPGILPGDDIGIVCPEQLTDKNGITATLDDVTTITSYGGIPIPSFIQVSCLYFRVFSGGSTSTAPFIIFTFAKDRAYFDAFGQPFVCIDSVGPYEFSSRERQFRVNIQSFMTESAAVALGAEMFSSFSRIAATCG